MDRRLRELQRHAGDDPEILKALLVNAYRGGCFSQQYLIYIASLNLSIAGNITSKQGINAVKRAWKEMYDINRYASYQRILLFILRLLTDFKEYPQIYASFFPYIDYLVSLYKKLLTFGPQNSPEEEQLQQLIEKWHEASEAARESDGSVYAIEAVHEVARAANHFLHAFSSEKTNCSCCDAKILDWNTILAQPKEFLPLTESHAYALEDSGYSEYSGMAGRLRLRQEMMKQILQEKKLSWKDLSSRERRQLWAEAGEEIAKINKKKRRKASNLKIELQKQFLKEAEYEVWLRNVYNFIPGQIWN